MYNYSPISLMRIKNFRNIGDITLDFSESPIITLVGDNEAGKTSVVKAFAVASAHAYVREQKDYIREGTQGYGIYIENEDKSSVTRLKTDSINKYATIDANGDKWETHKIDSGLPVKVQEIMGIMQEPETKEFLQIRTYEDLLLFVVTPASTNYKVMYNALKVEQLTRGIKEGSTEANELKAKIDTNEISIRTLRDNIMEIKTYDLEPVSNIKNRLKKQVCLLDKLEKAKSIKEKIDLYKDKLGNLNLIEEKGLGEIDLMVVDKLSSINSRLNNRNKLINEYNVLNGIDTLEEIECNWINKVNDIINRKISINKMQTQLDKIKDIENVELVNEYAINNLNKAKYIMETIAKDKRLLEVYDVNTFDVVHQGDFDIVNKAMKVMGINNRNTLLKNAETEINKYINQVEAYLKAYGAKVVVCDKCGEEIVVDTNN